MKEFLAWELANKKKTFNRNGMVWRVRGCLKVSVEIIIFPTDQCWCIKPGVNNNFCININILHFTSVMDTFLDCSASEAFDGTYQTNVVVTSEGQCTYIPPGHSHTTNTQPLVLYVRTAVWTCYYRDLQVLLSDRHHLVSIR